LRLAVHFSVTTILNTLRAVLTTVLVCVSFGCYVMERIIPVPKILAWLLQLKLIHCTSLTLSNVYAHRSK